MLVNLPTLPGEGVFHVEHSGRRCTLGRVMRRFQQMFAPRRRTQAAPLALLPLAALLAGCAQPGLPLAPSLKIPNVPADLSGYRAGATVTLHWTMPRRATDNVLLAGAQRGVICRGLDPAPCKRVASNYFVPGAPATWTETLPADLASGPARLLVYKVQLENHRGATAGDSNAFYTVAGDPPPAVDSLTATATPAGILLHWQAAAPPDAECLVRITRTRVLAKGEAASASGESSQGVPQPAVQTLEVPHGCTLDHATDRDAFLNRTYSYSAVRVERLNPEGHPIEVASAGSQAVELGAKDIFPPAVPSGLQAVADPDTGTIDLSWVPDAEPDLAGYIVYRRTASDPASGAKRVSGATPIHDAAWSDPHPSPAVAYIYSVSSIDTSGNESARSAEARETLTPAGPK